MPHFSQNDKGIKTTDYLICLIFDNAGLSPRITINIPQITMNKIFSITARGSLSQSGWHATTKCSRPNGNPKGRRSAAKPLTQYFFYDDEGVTLTKGAARKAADAVIFQ